MNLVHPLHFDTARRKGNISLPAALAESPVKDGRCRLHPRRYGNGWGRGGFRFRRGLRCGAGVGWTDGSGVGCGGDSDDSARAAAGWACGGSTPACCQSVNAAPGEQNSRARTLPPGTTRNARALPANAAVHSSAPSTRPALRMANTPLRNRYAPTAGQYAPSHACPPRKHCNISAKHEKIYKNTCNRPKYMLV